MSKAKPTAAKTKIRIYTMEYTPFILGGKVWQPAASEVDATSGPHDVGSGFQAYLVQAPNGRTFVAEAETGALIGPSLASVRNDIKKGSPAIMKEQMELARRDSKRARDIEPAELWRKLKCEKGTP